METDFREYTIREAAKSLTAIEIHLKQASDDAVFCNECVQKHFLEVQKFAEEGAGFLSENRKWWEDLETWAREGATRLTRAKHDQEMFVPVAGEVSSEARDRRKALIVMLERELTCPGGKCAVPEAHQGDFAYAGSSDPDVHLDEVVHDADFEGIDDETFDEFLLTHSIPALEGNEGAELSGHIVDKKRAQDQGCTCFELPGGNRLCFAKGVVGALDAKQQGQFCTPDKTISRSGKRVPKGLRDRISTFTDAAHECRVSSAKKQPTDVGKRFGAFVDCMRTRLKAKRSKKAA